MPHLPVELLLPIFRDLDTLSFPYYDLFSCSLVCRFWYHCAFPLLVESNLFPNTKQHLLHYENAELERLVSLMAESQRYGLAHGNLFEIVLIDIPNLFLKKRFNTRRFDRRKAEIIGRLLSALKPRTKTVELRFQHLPSAGGISRGLRDLVPLLRPGFTGITTLHVHWLSMPKTNGLLKLPLLCTLKDLRLFPLSPSSPFATPLPTSFHPMILLVYHLRSNIQHIHFSVSELTPSLLQVLRTCTKIRTASFERVSFDVLSKDFSDTVASWPDLQHLSIRDQERPLISLDPTITQLAQSPPPNLEILKLDNSRYIELGPTATFPQLRTLLSRCSPTLVSLMLPANHDNRDAANEFIAFFIRLELPCLEILDLSRARNMAIAEAAFAQVDETSFRIPWPKLRRLEFPACTPSMPRFVRVLIRSCPLLEVLRMYFTYESLPEVEELRAAGFVKMPNQGKWAGAGVPWVKAEVVGDSSEMSDADSLRTFD